MEKQVSALYPLSESGDKRKVMEITKVMKGALSVSKSRTGEEIYRSNSFHKKKLEKKVKQFKSVAKTEISSYESKKRTITQRFSVVFGKHKATNETMQAYDDVITRILENMDEKSDTSLHCHNKSSVQDKQYDDVAEEENVDDSGHQNNVKLPHVSNSHARTQETEKSIDETKTRKSVFIPTGILLPITTKFARLKFHEDVTEPEPEEEIEQVKELWPLENTEKYDNYIKTQKDRHEVLVTRNILKRIKKNITGKDTLLRFQMKSILADDPEEFVRNLTSAKTTPPENSFNKSADRHFKKFISRLPGHTAPSYAPLRSSRIFPPIASSASAKSTGKMLILKRSKTLPI